MANKVYKDVPSMLGELSGEGFSASVKKQISERRIVKSLQTMRVSKGISQARIAEKMKCTQGRVSKIENGLDDDLSFRDLMGYARALGCDVQLGFTKRGATSVDRVKAHALAIKRELEQLAASAQQDRSIANAVAGFFGESFCNLVALVKDSSEKLPRSDAQEPLIQIELELEELNGPDEVRREARGLPKDSEHPAPRPGRRRRAAAT